MHSKQISLLLPAGIVVAAATAVVRHIFSHIWSCIILEDQVLGLSQSNVRDVRSVAQLLLHLLLQHNLAWDIAQDSMHFPFVILIMDSECAKVLGGQLLMAAESAFTAGIDREGQERWGFTD